MADEKSRIDLLAEGFKDLSNVSGGAVKALEEVNAAVLSTGKGMDGITEAVKSAGMSLTSLSTGLGKVIGSVPMLGGLGTVFENLGGATNALTKATTGLSKAYMDAIRGSDQMSLVNRELAADNYKLAAQFGDSIDTASDFADFMLSSSRELAGADFGFQNFAKETKPMAEELAKARISFERMQEPIQTTAGSFDLYSMAVLHAQSLNLSHSEYANLMSDAILKQGMTTQEAAQTLSLYGDIAERTGLTVKVVAESLGGLGTSFRKMGLDANFGQSFLEGFSKSIEDTGIGIENAAELAKSFGERMAGLSTNYGSAFITAMRGGLDTGSGGALGAGIQLQAKLMDKDTDQAELGRDIAGAVRDTIASFTGGDIVTVTEAAESRDPRLELAFYKQTQLLESIYGITDATEQARTLELLEQMAEAQTTGDQDAMAAIGADLQSSLNMRNQTLSNEDKLNAIATSQLAELSLQTKVLGVVAAALAKENLVDPAGNELKNAVDAFAAGFSETSEGLEEYLDQVRTGRAESYTEALFGERPGGQVAEAFRGFESPGTSTDGLKDSGLMKLFREETLKVQDEGVVIAVRDLISALRDIISPVQSNGGRTHVSGTTGRG